MATISAFSGLTVSGASPELDDLTLADLVSGGAADSDPYVIMNAPLTVVGGVVNIQTTEQATARDGWREGALFTLNHHPDWVGDGEWSYLVKITPVDHPGVANPAFAFGLFDYNLAIANMRGQALGIRCPSTTNMQGHSVQATAASTFGVSSAFAAHNPSATIIYLPAGEVGDATNAAAPATKPGFISIFQAAFRWDPNNVLATPYAETFDYQVTGPFRPCLFVGWNSTGVDVCNWSIRVQWAVIPAAPIGTF